MIGLFDIAWRVCGMQDTLMSMALEDKSILNGLLDKALEFNLGVISQVPKYFDAIRFLEDWGTQKGLLWGSTNGTYFLKPRLREMYEATKSRGLVVMSHSCGDIYELFPHLIQIGVDVCDPIQTGSNEHKESEARVRERLDVDGRTWKPKHISAS